LAYGQSTYLDHSRHITMALGTQTDWQQRITCLDCPGAIGNRHLMTVFFVPDIRKQLFFWLTENGCQKFSGGARKSGMDSVAITFRHYIAINNIIA
jgi:hypothetical protein